MSGYPQSGMREAGSEVLATALRASRGRTLSVLSGLSPEQWRVPLRPEVNPPLWELGHVAWFAEYWCCRHREGQAVGPSMLADADRWYDSRAVVHRTRWELDLPDLPATLDYLSQSLEAVLARLSGGDGEDLYPFRLALFHEDMHIEAFCYTYQTLGYGAPDGLSTASCAGGREPGPKADLQWEGGFASIGMAEGCPGFVFDNEKWQHRMSLPAYSIAGDLVTNGEFLAFVEDRGYSRLDFWNGAAFLALSREGRAAPRYWRRHKGQWQERLFSEWRPLRPEAPVRHVDAFEAEAYCRWVGRRLPSEGEWEHSALTLEGFNWGRLWEWTSTVFKPYPGFKPDRYREYSAPWFYTHRSVRGASFASSDSYVHPRFRNFYEPHRADIFVGFRTCAL